MKKSLFLLAGLALVGAGCETIQPPSQVEKAVSDDSSCIKGTARMPWYQGDSCWEVTSNRSSDSAPTFVSASYSGMVWNKDELTAKPGSQVVLTVVVKDAKTVTLQQLVWNEGTPGLRESYPLQKQRDGVFQITFPFPDFQSFEYDTTYALHAEGMKSDDTSDVNLVLGDSWGDR